MTSTIALIERLVEKHTVNYLNDEDATLEDAIRGALIDAVDEAATELTTLLQREAATIELRQRLLDFANMHPDSTETIHEIVKIIRRGERRSDVDSMLLDIFLRSQSYD